MIFLPAISFRRWPTTAVAGCLLTLSCLSAFAVTGNGDDPVTKLYEAVKSGRMSPEEFRAAVAKLPATQPASLPVRKTASAPKTPAAAKPVTDSKSVPATTPKPSPPLKEPIDEFEDYVGIRKSFLSQDDEEEPAKVSWTKNQGAPSYYTLDLAVQLRGDDGYYDGKPKGFSFLDGHGEIGKYEVEWKVEPTFETHISSEEKNAQDSLSARLPITLSWRQDLKAGIPSNASRAEVLQRFRENSSSRFVTGWFLTISPVYEFDRLLNNETIGGDMFLTMNVPKLYIGNYKYWPAIPVDAGDAQSALRFNWRPFVGFEGGHVLAAQAGTDLDEQSEYARFSAKVHAELSFVHRRPQHKDGKPDLPVLFQLAADYYFRQNLEGEQHARSYVEVSAICYLDLDEHFSLGLTYKKGETTPKFEEVDSLNLWVGVKF